MPSAFSCTASPPPRESRKHEALKVNIKALPRNSRMLRAACTANMHRRSEIEACSLTAPFTVRGRKPWRHLLPTYVRVLSRVATMID